MVLDQKLSELIRENHISKSAFSDAVGISASTLSNYLNGTRLPGPETLVLMSALLGVSSDYLIGATKNPTPPKDQEEMVLKMYHFDAQKVRKDNHIVIFRTTNWHLS